MSETVRPDNLNSTFAVVRPGLSVEAVAVTDTDYGDLDARYDGFAGHTLVAAFRFKEDWPTWEIHPHGGDIVVLVAGSATLVLRLPEGDRELTLARPGDFVIVPRATWHTARTGAEAGMVFVTPGEGTENRLSPAGGG